MVTHYTTPQKVAEYLNIVPTFSDSTKPTLKTVQNIIRRIEEDIDHTTNNSWRERQVYQEPHNFDHSYVWGSGLPVPLLNRPVLVLDTDKGDKIEVWDGSSWIDWTSTKTEGRANDYWIDYNLGTLWIVSDIAPFQRSRAKVTYRYGTYVNTAISGIITESASEINVDSTAGFETEGTIRINNSEEVVYTGKITTSFTGCERGSNGTTATTYTGDEKVYQINLDIEDLATKMAALEILRTNFRTNSVPISGDTSIGEIMRGLREEIDYALRKNTRFVVIS